MTDQNRPSTVDSRKSELQPVSGPRTQAEKFSYLARELECDEDEAAFEEKVRKVANSSAHQPPKRAE